MATIREMIEFLERFPQDGEVRISVSDSYSQYGESAKLAPFDVGSHAFNTDANWLTLNVSLDKNEGKNPKITFRS